MKKDIKIIGIIPARYASTRLPAKALVEIGGRSMIRRVYEQVCRAKGLSAVWVATDDSRIFDHIKGFGGQVIMTSERHKSGTERCAEAVDLIGQETGQTFGAVVNIQGDEPFIKPQQIDEVITALSLTINEIATLIKRITLGHEVLDPNTPKVVVNHKMEAIYFSRQAIPFVRTTPVNESVDDAYLARHCFYKHIGIYAYHTATLKKIVALAPSYLEETERLEQLRWLENGFVIQCAKTDFEGLSVDTKADWEAACRWLEAQKT